MPRSFPYGDIKYFYSVHCRKQELQGKKPVSYNQFTKRLRLMNLHDAIHSPRVEHQVRDTTVKPTVNDFQRRLHILNEENVMVVDLNNLQKIESDEKPVIYPKQAKQPKTSKTNNEKQAKQSLFLRFISLFKKNASQM